MKPLNLPLIWAGKLGSYSVKKMNLGYGSTWPGHIALSARQNFIKDILAANPQVKIILIVGTNGKTTTSKLLRHILEENGLRVFQNESGANLLNGIASSLIKYSNKIGKLNYDAGIFEIDENTLPLVLKTFTPDSIVFLNLFRDQLDRYGEVNTIALKWQKALSKNIKLFVNGDDPMLSFLTRDFDDVSYFGIDEKLMAKKELSHDVDFIYCPKCGNKLTFHKISYSHMGIFSCNKCGYKSQKSISRMSDIQSPLLGSYNIYNTNAATLVAQKVFDLTIEDINKSLKEFKPAFGRQEIIDYDGRKIIVLLSKNPTGFNQSLGIVNDFKQTNKTVLLVLNDRIPDGRDVSWIWDVDFEELNADNIVASGDRTYDMALRINYANLKSKMEVEDKLQTAIETAINKTKTGETLFILPTYSAMLETRKILKGRKIL